MIIFNIYLIINMIDTKVDEECIYLFEIIREERGIIVHTTPHLHTYVCIYKLSVSGEEMR